MPTLPPVIERELRIAAKNEKLFLGRGGVAVLGFFAAVFAMEGTSGQGSLRFLMWCGWLFTHFLGGLLVCRSITDERREGTLGLLFLTPLRPTEVIGGKLAAQLTIPISMVLALVPAMTIAILAGGVLGSNIFHIAAALLNSAFCSMALGLLLGAWSKEDGQPGLTTFALLGFQAFAAMIAMTQFGPFDLHGAGGLSLLVLSPVPVAIASKAISGGGYPLFWEAIAMSHLGGWIMLVLAGRRCLAIMRNGGEPPSLWSRLRRGRAVVSNRGRATPEMLGRNPTEWLIRRNTSVAASSWGLCISAIAVMGGFAFFYPSLDAEILLPMGYLFGWGFKLLALTAGCDAFMREKKNGTLEFILATPMTPEGIRRGFFIGLARPLFRAFAVAFLAVVVLVFALPSLRRETDIELVALLATWGLVIGGDMLVLVMCGLNKGLTAATPRTAVVLALVQGWLVPGFFTCFLGVVGTGGSGTGVSIGVIVGATVGWMIAGAAAWNDMLADLRRRKLDPMGVHPAEFASFIHPATETPSEPTAK